MHWTDPCIINWRKKCLRIWKHNLLKKIKQGLLRFILKKIKCCLTLINYKTNWNKIQKRVCFCFLHKFPHWITKTKLKKIGNMGKKLKSMTINHTRSLKYIFKCLDKKNQLLIYVEVNKQINCTLKMSYFPWWFR